MAYQIRETKVQKRVRLARQGLKSARQGGIARAASLTPARRKEIAQRAANARWGRVETRI